MLVWKMSALPLKMVSFFREGKVGVILMEENPVDPLRLIVLTYELVRDVCSINSSLS